MARHRTQGDDDFRLAKWVTTCIVTVFLAIGIALGVMLVGATERSPAKWEQPHTPITSTTQRR